VQQIRLRLRENTLQFHAGQYLEIVHPSGAGIPLSVASSPLRLPELVFHYQSTRGSHDARLVDELLDAGRSLQLKGPGGDVFVNAETTSNLLLIAGGTGVSQALAIIDDLHLRQASNKVTLLCCADRVEDFYFKSLLHAQSKPWLTVEYLADPRRTADNRAMRWLQAHAGEHLTDRILLCGGPPFVYAACDAVVAGGIKADNTESDVYAYAPRN